ncbi:MFS transporter [Streptomyces sp. PTY087I2]|uniref:MFS transporter n=1 Tax=Streptomyces sp. PTY087I2 TaxID=1819298 RepID=UPI00080BEB8E|nr:MFS transporter [Streptomyces sp. PTY087I2]OCC09392.1 Major Facilitator Superfamily protein [Streptomyces sp. PTY087I2]
MSQPATPEWSYVQALKNPRLALFLGGVAFSGIGDGMLIAAIPLLAMKIHGDLPVAIAVSLAAAAPFVSSTLVALPFSLGTRRFPVRGGLVSDCLLRGAALAAAGLAAVSENLTIFALIGALFVGSCLRSVGTPATRLAALGMAPSHGRFAVNGLLATVRQFTLYVVGPAIGGLIAGFASPEWALVVDGATFLPLLLATLLVVPRSPSTRREAKENESGLKVMRRLPVAWRLLIVVFFFNLLYMPVEVALPLLVNGPLGGDGKALGVVWTLFGAGALLGALATNFLRSVPQVPLMMGIIASWGATTVGLALSQNVASAAVAFFVGGVVYAPFTPVAYSYLHTFLSEKDEQPVLTLWSTVSTLAAPIGLLAAGPLVHALGGRGAVFLSAFLILALALGMTRMRPMAPPEDPPPAAPAVQLGKHQQNRET